MEDNRYAPPRAEVEGATLEGVAGPALWNPNAAANWSLLFSPIFGTWLHMLNWRALGETRRAESAKTWLMVSTLLQLGVCVGGALMPFSGLERLRGPLAFLLLIAWYFSSARGQAKWVAEHYGNRYPRRGWTQPLLGALVLLIGSAVALLVFASIGRSFVET